MRGLGFGIAFKQPFAERESTQVLADEARSRVPGMGVIPPMESRISAAIALRTQPVSLRFTDSAPEGATSFPPKSRGCVVSFLVQAATRGQISVVDRDNHGCPGAKTGMCFGNPYPSFPGGIDAFLSNGAGEGFPPGERYFRDPETANRFSSQLPYRDLPTAYVAIEPLSAVPEGTHPDIVVFFVNAARLAALHCLTHFGRGAGDQVILPFGAGCHTVCLLPYAESGRETPRAVAGCLDPTVRTILPVDELSFAVPWRLYEEIEANVDGSFVGLPLWQKVLERIERAESAT